MMARHACAPLRKLWSCKHGKTLMALENVRSFAATGRGTFGQEQLMMDAFDSVRLDCIQLRRLRMRLTLGHRAPAGPVGSLPIAMQWVSWMAAMDYLARYRRLLRGNIDNIARHTMCREVRSKGPVMFHNFTRVAIGQHNTHVLIHNSKATNGEGGTRVILFVQEAMGAWTPYCPHIDEIGDAFEIYPRSTEYDQAKKEVDDAFDDIFRKNRTIKSMQSDIIRMEEEDPTTFKGKILGMKKGISKITEKKRAVSSGNRERWQRMVRTKQVLATTTTLKILDLSYDDLYSGLAQLIRKLRWSERRLAGVMLCLLGLSKPCVEDMQAIQTVVELKGLKVKDLVSPRDDTRTANIRISGLDLCMSLMSIMFITEPKHSLPMAISNVDALRAVSRGLIPLEVLFAPIEVVFVNRKPMFRVGGMESLGSVLASANNQRVVLDPSVRETRLIKEASMPVTELVLSRQDERGTIGQGLERLTQDVAWGDDEDMRKAACFFPLLKCVLIRAILENADW